MMRELKVRIIFWFISLRVRTFMLIFVEQIGVINESEMHEETRLHQRYSNICDELHM